MRWANGLGGRLGLALVVAVSLGGSTAWGQENANTPPVFVPFEEADLINPGLATDDDSIAGFFDVERRFLSVLQNADELSRQFETFENEARASIDQVPIPSGSVSVSYRFDPALETFVREARPFAPAISQRARTDGRGVLTVGVGYSDIRYKNFNGDDRDQVVLLGALAGPGGAPLTDGQGNPLVDASLFQFKLRQSIATISAQYGVTDWLDVGVLIPVIDESFRARAIERFFIQNPDGSLQPALISAQGVVADERFPSVREGDLQVEDFNSPTPVPLFGFSSEQDETGVGDIILRSKAFLADFGPIETGAGLNLAVPSGDEDNLLGVGAVRVDPRVLLSTANDRFGVHVNLGFHGDFEESDRNRFDYSVGGEVLLVEWATLLVDQIGRYEYGGPASVQKFDIVPGIKLNPWKNAVVGFNAIVPLNDDGLRADFIPNGTAEISMAF